HLDATSKFVRRLRRTSDRLEPYRHRYLLLAAAILGDRVPVHPWCSEAVLLDLIEAARRGFDEDRLIAGLVPADDAPVTEPVLAAAADAFAEVRSWRVQAALVLLARWRPADGRRLLEQALAARDPDARALAAALLVRHGETGPNVVRHLKAKWYTTKVTRLDVPAQALLEEAWASPSAQQALVQLLDSDSDEVRVIAAQALRGSEQYADAAQQALVQLLDSDSDEVRVIAAQALRGSEQYADAAQQRWPNSSTATATRCAS
ncbi:unnamed protein product, partial [marine sediment metagenome]